MKTIIVASLFLYSTTAICEVSMSSIQKEKLISEKQQVISAKLKDPDSAKFRNVFISNLTYEPTVCGEINAKNSYGAYGGYEIFYVSNDGAKIGPHISEWEAFCERDESGK
jgi:hypothetical protein